MNITLVDSPVANVANIERALTATGATVTRSDDPQVIRRAEKIVLPGVGSFRAAMDWLQLTGIAQSLRDTTAAGTPLLGICVGHQVLFESSDEMGVTRGLALIAGDVAQLKTALPVPQIGWNRVHCNGSRLFDGIPSGTPFYFVNSFVAVDAVDEIAQANYGDPFTAAVARANIFGVQFHPEKSSAAGLRVLRNFVWM